MDKITVVNLLTNSGISVLGMDNNFIYFQDPTCIFPAFDTFLDYAWIVVIIFTAILLFGWAALYIKNGVKIDSLFNNAKALILILCTLSLVKPAANFIYGDDLFAKQCETKQVSVDKVQELLDSRKKQSSNLNNEMLYETFDVIDSGVIFEKETQNNQKKQPAPISYNNETRENVNEEIIVSDFITAQHQSGAVIYVRSNGERIKRSGGTVAWRNNNPGNIINSRFAFNNGAIGVAGRFAIFPDEQTGMMAIKSLLRSNAYVNLTISQAIHKWAPAADNNNPARYTRHVSQLTGLDATRTINSLSDAELDSVANAIRTHEGWRVGTEQRI